jgi:hypothetical protein
LDRRSVHASAQWASVKSGSRSGSGSVPRKSPRNRGSTSTRFAPLEVDKTGTPLEYSALPRLHDCPT